MGVLREKYVRDLKLRSYAEVSVRAYVRCVVNFVRYSGKAPSELTLDDVLKYQLYLKEVKKYAPTTVNVSMAALRFLYITTLGMNWNPKAFPFLKKKRTIPLILSLDEVIRLISAVDRLKNRTALLTIYAGGLRINEAVHLKAQDIQSDRMLIHVRFGKGNKERYTLLPPVLINALRFYWKNCPDDKSQWLFPGQLNSGSALSTRSVRRAFHDAKKKAGLGAKDITVHTLRHCFATHLLEMGVDIKYIQVLLGHERIETTEIYTRARRSHIMDLLSPLEALAQKLTWLP